MGVLLVIAIIVGVTLFTRQDASPVLRAGNHAYQLEVVTTTTAQQKGLSGRPSLPINQGMLFSFTSEAQRCFWMKDMRFSVDMLWFNTNKQVVHIEPSVSPKTYPKIFCPSRPAKYVIEINAGQAKAAGITVGQTLKF